MDKLARYKTILAPCGRVYYDEGFNCRGPFTLQSLKSLADNISKRGLDIPVTVQPACDVVGGLPEGFDFRLIAGHRRFRVATYFLKWTEIPAFLREGLSEQEARVLNLAENLERQDLNHLEEALAIAKLFPADMPQAHIAKALNRCPRWVSERTKILQLPEQIQQMIAAKRIALIDMEVLFRYSTPEEQIKAAEIIAASKRGKKKRVFEGERLERKFRRRLTKEAINGLIRMIYDAGLEQQQYLTTRALACCNGGISIDEFAEDVRNAAKTPS